MFAPQRSKRLRASDYERVLSALGSMHQEQPPPIKVWRQQPVTGFTARLLMAIALMVDDNSFTSISLMPDPKSREYTVIASARVCSQEQRVVLGLNKELARMIREHDGYRAMLTAVQAGHVVSDGDLMSKREIVEARPWRELYQPRNVGFSTVFTMPGVTSPYYIGVFRNEAPLNPREVKMLDLFRSQVVTWAPWTRRVEMPTSQLASGADARLSGLGLRPSEAEVLAWVCEGKRDAEIAIILGKSVRTVQTQVAAVLNKLGVETRTAAAAVAMDHLRATAADVTG